jgi:hypothetical protein
MRSSNFLGPARLDRFTLLSLERVEIASSSSLALHGRGHWRESSALRGLCYATQFRSLRKTPGRIEMCSSFEKRVRRPLQNMFFETFNTVKCRLTNHENAQ